MSPKILGVDCSPFVNQTTVARELVGAKELEGAFPRWIALAKISSANDKSLGETGTFVSFGVSIKS